MVNVAGQSNFVRNKIRWYFFGGKQMFSLRRRLCEYWVASEERLVRGFERVSLVGGVTCRIRDGVVIRGGSTNDLNVVG